MVYKRDACPDCGACSFMGTASTMQVMAEALGIALPGSALIPAHLPELKETARKAGEHALGLAREELKPSDIMTIQAFENAIMVHAAIAGSSNSLLHLPAIAHELGIQLSPDLFDKIHRKIPYLLNIRPSGFWPGAILLVCGRRTGDHGRNQGIPPSRCQDRYRQNIGRKLKRFTAQRLL